MANQANDCVMLRRFLGLQSRAAEIDARAERPALGATSPSTLVGVASYFASIIADIRQVRASDPAARGYAEVLLAYPGVHAVWMHRPIHALWRRGFTVLPRVLSNLNRFLNGADIHPGAVIGRGVFIDHAMGVVIGETAVVGDDCLIYQGVSLAGTSLERKVRHPKLGKAVVVGANASVLGAISVGDHARVGSGSVVIHNVPPHATVVGVPGRVRRQASDEAQLDHSNLPDPTADLIRTMTSELERLERRIAELEEQKQDAPLRPVSGR